MVTEFQTSKIQTLFVVNTNYLLNNWVLSSFTLVTEMGPLKLREKLLARTDQNF